MSALRFILPAVGLEPTRGCPQQILSLPRLPFRHAGISCTTSVLEKYNVLSRKKQEKFLRFSYERIDI